MIRLTFLENGVRVATEAIPGARSLSIGVLSDAGPADEEPGLEGTAHFAEHLLFQGTSSRSSLDIARFMDAAGGSLGAFTSRDYTCFYASVLDDFATFAVDLFGDILLNSTFPAPSVERHRGAVLAEMAADVETPRARALASLRRHAWGDHPLGRPITGTDESVRRLTREDVIYFVHQNYTPDRLVIAAAGNVDHEDFVAQTRDAFWRLLGASVPRRAPPPPFRGGIVVAPGAGTLAHFALGLPSPAYASPDRYAQHVLDRILGGGLGSRLFRRVREELGLAYDISSEILAHRDAGLWLVEGCCAPPDLPKVLAEAFDVVRRLATGEEAPGEDEVERVKSQLRSQHLLGGESSHTRMSRVVTQQLYFGASVPDASVLGAIEALDIEALRGFAETTLRQALGDAALAVIDPSDSRSRRTQLAALLSDLRATASPKPTPR